MRTYSYHLIKELQFHEKNLQYKRNSKRHRMEAKILMNWRHNFFFSNICQNECKKPGTNRRWRTYICHHSSLWSWTGRNPKKKKIFLFHHKGALNLFFQCFVCPTQCENFRVFLNTIQILGEMNFKSDIFTKIYIQSLKNIVKMAVFNFQKLAKIDFT